MAKACVSCSKVKISNHRSLLGAICARTQTTIFTSIQRALKKKKRLHHWNPRFLLMVKGTTIGLELEQETTGMTVSACEHEIEIWIGSKCTLRKKIITTVNCSLFTDGQKYRHLAESRGAQGSRVARGAGVACGARRARGAVHAIRKRKSIESICTCFLRTYGNEAFFFGPSNGLTWAGCAPPGVILQMLQIINALPCKPLNNSRVILQICKS